MAKFNWYIRLQVRMNRIVDKGRPGDWPSTAFDHFIITLVFLNVAVVILESYDDIQNRYSVFFWYFDHFSVWVFTLEYLLRIWTAEIKYKKIWFKAVPAFIFSTTGLIDLLAILPFYLPLFFTLDFRLVRILSLFRLLKLQRYSKSLTLIYQVFKDKREELGVTVILLFSLLLISAGVMYHVENKEQPEAFPNIIETAWWAVNTITTVGYGDVYPKTGLGRLFGGVIALISVGLGALPAGILSAGFLERFNDNQRKKQEEQLERLRMDQQEERRLIEQERRERMEQDAKFEREHTNAGDWKYCPHCGKRVK